MGIAIISKWRICDFSVGTVPSYVVVDTLVGSSVNLIQIVGVRMIRVNDIYRHMLNQHPIHILNQMGVITSFSVAKKITEEAIHKFFARYKKAGKTEAEIDTILKDKVLHEIQDAIMSQKIPGLLSPEELAKEFGINQNVIANMPEMNRLIMVVAQKLAEKNYGKMSLCYFINSLVNCLGLSESDFEKFHQQNSGEDGDDEDGDDEFKDA